MNFESHTPLGQACKRSRASKPKVRTGCITCKLRRVKCDESKPQCDRCTSTGRKCDGYIPVSQSVSSSQELVTVNGTSSSRENRALEFFFRKTAPQLAGFYGRSFWKGSVLQFSLTEPAVRHGIAALAALHEAEAFRDTSSCYSTGSGASIFALQSYNRAIRSVVDKAVVDLNIPIVIMACIIFTSFECLRRNVDEALNHITGGISLLKSWREKSGGGPNGPWGQRYISFESSFVETELAPILSCLNLAASECGRRPFLDIFLNPVNLDGSLTLGESFETVSEARVGLMDLLTAGIRLTQSITAESTFHREKPIVEALNERGWLGSALQRWKTAWDDLVQQHQEFWGKEEKSAADFVRLIWHCANIESHTWISGTETAWDSYKVEYEEMIRLAESLLSDAHYFPDEPCRRISAELGVIFPLQAVAWKCRWPLLRRRALALLRQTSKRECLLDADHYHTIFSRIVEIEEGLFSLPPGAVPNEDTLPPEHVRVHHFYIAAQPASAMGGNLYAATFLTKPNGLDKEWHYQTEYLDLGVRQVGEAAVSSVLLPGYKSIGCEF